MPLTLRIISENRKLVGEGCTRSFVACGGTIGRSLDNDWALPDPQRYVSGRHALIDFQGGAYYIVDTSRNGVYMNGADTPVGRGHPQRLFDGDQMRIGEFDILVEVIEDDEALLDDGMRDSVVRAQLVKEDESLELALMDEKNLVGDDSLSAHLASEGNSVAQAQAVSAEGSAKAGLLEAAGLDRNDLPGIPESEIMQVCGTLLRRMVAGLMDLLAERAAMKENFRMSQTIIRAEPNNPLKFAPNVDDALRYLLGDRSDSYLSAEEAVGNVVRDIRNHEAAVIDAMRQALADYVDRFDPDELRTQYDRGLKRNGLLAGANKLKYWELYHESYQVLTQHQDGRLPDEFTKEFARAYEDQVARLRSAEKTGCR